MNCSGKHTAMMLLPARQTAGRCRATWRRPTRCSGSGWHRRPIRRRADSGRGGGRLRRTAVRDQPARPGPCVPQLGGRPGPEAEVADAMRAHPELVGGTGPGGQPTDAGSPRPARQGRRGGSVRGGARRTAARWRSRSTTVRCGPPTARCAGPAPPGGAGASSRPAGPSSRSPVVARRWARYASGRGCSRASVSTGPRAVGRSGDDVRRRQAIRHAGRPTALAERGHSRAVRFSTVSVPERLSYRIKRVLLGPPLVGPSYTRRSCPRRPRSVCCPATASPPPPTAPRRC